MSLYFQWGGCFAALLVEGPWCNPWISGEPNHLENSFPGSSERNRKRTTPSEILNDAIDEKNPPLVCRIPSAVSIVWWLLCSSAKVYLYISHLPWICSRKFGNSSKNTSYQMMIKHGDQIHKRIPKNSTLRQKTRHQGTEQGGEYRFKYHPQKTPWSLIKNEEGATRIKWYYYTLLPFLPFDFLKTVPWCSLCQRFSEWNVVYHKLSHELHCFSSFFTNQSQLTGDTSASPPFFSHQTIGAHARQCAAALGAVKGMKFFFFFAFKSSKLADDS